MSNPIENIDKKTKVWKGGDRDAQFPMPDNSAEKWALRRLFYSDAVRAVFIQVLSIVLFTCAAYYLLTNFIENLNQVGLPFSFDFLNVTAGFDIGWSIISYDPTMTYSRVFLVGIINTLILSAFVIVASTLLGFLVGLMRLSHNPLVFQLARWYVEIIRNVPLLIQIVFWFTVVFSQLPSPKSSHSLFDLFQLNNRGFYSPSLEFDENYVWTVIAVCLALVLAFILRKRSNKLQKTTGKRAVFFYPSLLGLLGLVGVVFMVSGSPFHWDVPTLRGFNFKGGWFLPSAFLAAFLAMTIYRSATIAETVRAGIGSVNKGQIEASATIGFTKFQTTRLIVMPQAGRAILPPLINAWLTVIKESSLAVAIGFPELVSLFMQTSINQTGRAIEIVLLVMLFYMFVSLFISFVLNKYNAKIQLKER